MEKVNSLFVAPNRKLYYESKFFRKGCHEINGVSVTELWRDAYQRNLEKGTEVLFPVEMCSPFPFPIVDHIYSPGFKNGGGFRLNLNCAI